MDEDTNTPMTEDSSMPAAGATGGEPGTEATGKPRAKAPYVVLGFIGALFFGFFLAPLVAALLQALAPSVGESPALAVVQILTLVVQPVLLLLTLGLSIAALIVGKNKRDAKLASLGKGGVAAFVTAILVTLLAFGTCMVMLGANGL